MIARTRAAATLAVLLAAATLTDPDAHAQIGAGCTLEATPVVFGAYNVFSPVASDSTGTVTARCLLGIGVTIGLGPGGAGSFAPRRMSGGGSSLSYNLYTNAARTSVWGDGTGGTSTSFILLQAFTPVTRTVHGRIFPLQDAAAGAYADTVTVTFVF